MLWSSLDRPYTKRQTQVCFTQAGLLVPTRRRRETERTIQYRNRGYWRSFDSGLCAEIELRSRRLQIRCHKLYNAHKQSLLSPIKLNYMNESALLKNNYIQLNFLNV